LSLFEKTERDPSLRRSLGFKDEDHVIVYMGSFFYFSGLTAALKEFANLVARDLNFKFLLIGGGEQDGDLRKLVLDLEIQDQVVFTGFIEYQELPRYLKVADVAVNTLESTLVANVALPNKVLQYLAAGLLVVSTKLEGLVSVFHGQQAVTWTEDARAVIRDAIQIKEKRIVAPRATSLDVSNSVLSIFEPEITAGLFENSLSDLAQKGTV
jgi:glycosyltransferase involved in cell wall biosynthesis